MTSALTAPAPTPRTGPRALRPIYVTKGGDMLNPLTPPPTDPPSYRARYTARDVAPGQARRDVERVLTSWGLEEKLAESAKLVVSELVTNAVTHTSTRVISLTLTRTGGTTVRIVVMDTDRTEIALPDCPGDDEEAGRGLLLVASLAARWGIKRVVTGKLIWCDLEQVRP